VVIDSGADPPEDRYLSGPNFDFNHPAIRARKVEHLSGTLCKVKLPAPRFNAETQRRATRVRDSNCGLHGRRPGLRRRQVIKGSFGFMSYTRWPVFEEAARGR